VQFTDQSSGNINFWAWSFGDGGTSTLRSPVYTYTSLGLYTVTLIVSGRDGSDIEAKTDYITVVEGVQITLDPMAGGTLVYTRAEGGSTIVQVPPGAVTDTVTLRYVPILTVTNEPDSFHFAGFAFSLNVYRNGVAAPGYRFAQPVTITVNYADDDIAGLDEGTLTLHTWNGSAWVDAAESCTPVSTYQRNPLDNWLSVAICHLSELALFARPTTPAAGKVYMPVILKTGS